MSGFTESILTPAKKPPRGSAARSRAPIQRPRAASESRVTKPSALSVPPGVSVTAADVTTGLGTASIESGQVRYDPGSAYNYLAVGESEVITYRYNVVDGHTGIEHSIPVAKIYDDVVQLWSRTRTGYTPTLVVGYGGGLLLSDEEHLLQFDRDGRIVLESTCMNDCPIFEQLGVTRLPMPLGPPPSFASSATRSSPATRRPWASRRPPSG